MKEADLLLVIGARLGEMTTSGYTLLSVPRPAQKLIHVHAGAEELGRVYQGDLLINSGMPQFAAALAAMAPRRGQGLARIGRVCACRLPRMDATPARCPARCSCGEVVAFLEQRLPADAILTNGAGNYAGWLHRFYPLPRCSAPSSRRPAARWATACPPAIAAKVVHPERIVVSWNGDGCFLMNGQELATAVQYGASVIFIVVNNGMYGTIRMHQEREYPARVHGTALANPGFRRARARLRRARRDGRGDRRSSPRPSSAPYAEASGKPALIELRIDPQAITPNTTLDALRQQALKRAG